MWCISCSSQVSYIELYRYLSYHASTSLMFEPIHVNLPEQNKKIEKTNKTRKNYTPFAHQINTAVTLPVLDILKPPYVVLSSTYMEIFSVAWTLQKCIPFRII